MVRDREDCVVARDVYVGQRKILRLQEKPSLSGIEILPDSIAKQLQHEQEEAKAQ